MENPGPESSFVKITAGLVIFMGILSLSSWMISPYKGPKRSKLKIAERTLASVNTSSVSNQHYQEILPEKIKNLDLKCIHDGKKTKITSEAKLIRIVGRYCDESHFSIDTSMITNRTNGFSVLMFKTKWNQFSTDYIDLVQGENSILLHIEDEKGNKKVAEVIVQRLPASTDDSN